MDRNTVVGFILIAIIFSLYFMYTANEAEKKREWLKDHPAFADSLARLSEPATAYLDTMPVSRTEEIEQGERGVITGETDSVLLKERLRNEFAQFSPAAVGQEVFATLENEYLKIIFSNKGGSIKSVEVKGYSTHDSLPLLLFDGDENHTNLQFFINNNRTINTNELFFDAKEKYDEVVFRLYAGERAYLEQRYSFNPEHKYLLDFSIKMVGFNNIIPRNAGYLNFFMKRDLRQLEDTKDNENRYTAAFYKYTNDDVNNLSESGDDSESLSTSFSWVSFKQQFFNATLISKDGFYRGNLRSTTIDDPGYLKTMEASITMLFKGEAKQDYNMSYYFGPNHYKTLRSLGIGLDELVMVTGFMSFISPVNKWLIIPVFNWLEGFNLSYGIIILILTLLIKVLLFPLSYKSIKSMAMMKALQPELNQLKEKHKGDQQKFAAEQWKLFKSAGVSPLGGCLPQLLQFPILIAMFYFFPTSIELRHESFLWAHDLSTYDSILDLPFTIPFYGDHVSLFTLLMTVSSILYAVTQPQMSNQPGMKYMPYIFPIMLLGIFNSFPAALTYYYFLTNITSYLQQWLTKKYIIDEASLHKKIQENKKKPVKKSMWQKKLEEVSRQQRDAQKKKKRS